MAADIKKLFDQYTEHLKFDDAFAKKVMGLDAYFVTKNLDHVEFFGSPLLGVHIVRWTDDDRNRWMDDILFVDDLSLEKELHSLPSVNSKFKVQSDVVNLSFVYILHRVLNSDMNPKLKDGAAASIVKLMHYKFLTSLLANYFRHPADKNIAVATYNALTLKSDIKKYGSWGGLINARADDILSSKGIHRLTFAHMRDDSKVLYVLSDVQTRIREVVKSLTKLFYLIRDSDGKIVTTSSMMTTDEGIAVRDTQRTYTTYRKYINDVLQDRKDFIRSDLLKVVLSINPSARPDVVEETLTLLVEGYSDPKYKEYKVMVNDVLLYLFEYMRKHRIRTSDIAFLLNKMKAMLVGSRVFDEKILKAREIGDGLVYRVVGKQSATPVSPDRTAALLYLIGRTLTKNYYSS